MLLSVLSIFVSLFFWINRVVLMFTEITEQKVQRVLIYSLILAPPYFPMLLTSCISEVHLLYLMSQCWCIIINWSSWFTLELTLDASIGNHEPFYCLHKNHEPFLKHWWDHAVSNLSDWLLSLSNMCLSFLHVSL